MKQKYIFLLSLLCFFQLLNAQTNYEVVNIPFQNYTVNAIPLQTYDDMYSDYIPLEFDFIFFGNTYNQILISTNGVINFSGGIPNSGAQWSLNSSIPSTTFQTKNSIFGCFHDMDNRNNFGSLTYSTVGLAPFRKFVVMFQNQPHFSPDCESLRSTFQVILYETYHIIDVQINDKPVCATWNDGNALIGILNEVGDIGYTPENRNTGAWTAQNEGYRFKPEMSSSVYYYTKCDIDSDLIETFDLSIFENDLNIAPQDVQYFMSYSDAENAVNPLGSNSYVSTGNVEESIFAFHNDIIYELRLISFDCNFDADIDTVPSNDEDLNNDGNLSNDDTDGDGIPDFLDNDDDGDLVLTEFEYVFTNGRFASNSSVLLDTDNDTIPNYLDNDDDGDGIDTIDEDYNGNFNPIDDDTNTNNIPDYLDNTVALNLNAFELSDISIYPNPVKNTLNIKSNKNIYTVDVFDINGQLMLHQTNQTLIDVSVLSLGVYIVKIVTSDGGYLKKFIKN